MAGFPDVVKKIMRFKLQLTDTAESATVLKILQKLKDLDVTLDILAETGIGKTVNSFRRHEQAGEIAKSLVRGWKRLVPKESTSQTEGGDLLESLSAQDKLGNKDSPNNGRLTVEDLNNNFFKYQDKSQDSLDKALDKTGSRKTNSDKQCKEQIKHKGHENQNVSQSRDNVFKEKSEIKEDRMNDSFFSKEQRNSQSTKLGARDTLLGRKNSEDAQQKARSDPKEETKSNSDKGILGTVKELSKKSDTSKELIKEGKESLSFESRDKYSKTLKLARIKGDRSSGMLRNSEAKEKKRKKTNEEKQEESESERPSKHKKAKKKHRDQESYLEEPSMSFESYLNYDTKVLKKNVRSGAKKYPPKSMTALKEAATKDPGSKAFMVPMTTSVTTEKQLKESVMDLLNAPSSAFLPEYENPYSVELFERKVEKESDFCDVSEESAGFTGQRLNRKMQVYSGSKTIFLPTMMSLHQQCIRTLQNNINLLYETGGVPFEILEPVLERCTPEQLLRIEEYNPIYIGLTDHLWGKHCQRDFKHSKLQEYESWKELYLRLSEEREMKLQRLTKSIVSAHSKKPRGRQVKMAFIHTVAKPPRDVRLQQEIHGTAVQQPPQPRCSVKVPDCRPKPNSNEQSRSSSGASGLASTQDTRKKPRVAPMMAKSLKAFKKQLGRR